MQFIWHVCVWRKEGERMSDIEQGELEGSVDLSPSPAIELDPPDEYPPDPSDPSPTTHHTRTSVDRYASWGHDTTKYEHL